jgi:glutamate-1-semialdehyde 2,1-aminomutase
MMSSNQALLREATNLLPGASLGSFFIQEKDDLVIDRGKGSRVWDVGGREFIDYILGSGPMVIGHAHPAVVAAVQAQIERGATFYALNEPAIRLADKIVKAAPCAETVKFCGAGAEATFYALRLARAATGREKIVKFEGGYHGHHDYAMMSVWPKRLDPFPAASPDSAGIPHSVSGSVLIAPFNDLATTVSIMEQHKDDLAAVIVEPLSRMLEPVPGFLEGLREATRRLGALLIFDEVVTGFRVAYGGAQELYGVVPDLACYGKIIGGGLPLAAVAGKHDVLELANPRKKGAPDYTYISGTLNGNPVSSAAGLATLGELEKPGAYARLRAVGDRLRAGLREVASRLEIPAQVLGRGPLANIYFSVEPVVDYRSSLKADSRLTQQLGSELLARGVLTNLSAKMYLSLVHSDQEIDTTLQAFEDSLKAITAGRR